MDFNYKMSRNDLKKMYIKDYQKINMIYIVLTTITFIFITKDLFKYNLLFFLLFYIIIIIIFSLILHLFNHLYVEILLKVNDKKSNTYGTFNVAIDKNGIISKNDSTKLIIKWNEIKNVNFNKNRIYIKYENKNRLVFIINKDFLENKNDFEKITKIINENINMN